MATKRRYVLKVCGAAMGAAALAGCRPGPGPGPRPAPESRAAVTVAPVGRESIAQRLELTGDVRPAATVLLASKVPGRLERLGVESAAGGYMPLSEGLRVRRGDALARIDLAVYETRLKQAQAAAAIAQAQFQDAQREEQRMMALFQDGSATEQMRDKAVTARRIAEAARAQAEAALALAQNDVAEATPRAPLDGIVTRKHVDEGNLVSVGLPLATIEDLSRAKIVLSVPERYVAAIEPGRTKAFVSSVAGGRGAETVVEKVYPAIDAATRTGTLEILLDNAQGRFRSGSFVHVALEVARADDAVVVPLSAITWQGQEAFVFVVENGRARRRAVQVGIRDQERCQITAGLQPGEMLVTDGFRNLRDGDDVAPREGGR